MNLLYGGKMYTLKHLDVDNMRHIYGGKNMVEQQVESIRSIAQLKKEMPNFVILTLHDNFEYQYKYLDPFLSDGILSPIELDKIKKYEKNIFDQDLHLLPEAFPKFIPPTKEEQLAKLFKTYIIYKSQIR